MAARSSTRCPTRWPGWLRAWVTGTLRTDSREVKPGDAFIAWPGPRDRRPPASSRGALARRRGRLPRRGRGRRGLRASTTTRIATLPGLKAATGADRRRSSSTSPSAALDVVAATGTNGKTSTAWWTAQALTALGRRCGVIGTLGIGEPPLRATTPGTHRVRPA